MREKRRYFIELQPTEGEAPSRRHATEQRREQAAQFISKIHTWLERVDLQDKVAAMAVTAMGQVHIICDADIISHLRHHDESAIAVIRPAAALAGHLLDRL